MCDSVLLSTNRLLVRPFTADDTAALHAILSDPDVMRYIEPPFSVSRTETFLRENGLCRSPRIYAITLRTGEFIGQLIWHPYDASAYELGWILCRSAWGHGYAKELTAALMELAKAQGIPALIIECSPAQRITVHLAESLGFVPIPPNDLLLRFRYTV